MPMRDQETTGRTGGTETESTARRRREWTGPRTATDATRHECTRARRRLPRPPPRRSRKMNEHGTREGGLLFRRLSAERGRGGDGYTMTEALKDEGLICSY
eukprot:CAMPEP_0113561140 /NCGR_PEP_ID=MMETSP0015_2-20120614/19819_1 /TAXON_ID=2838 /ORGANISM="Odontella" /LENGTH=100 /DNA_ID=CAMNT_0000462919 /DNA_START=376 /DNA_END=678 /DNA_ORIENTATION=+ /assembly_acc=CAM_ASM_000160